MRTVNIHEAKTHLSRLIEQAVSSGESFIIAKAGRPLVKVAALARSETTNPRVGFMRGRIAVPERFDDIGRDAIADMFDPPR